MSDEFDCSLELIENLQLLNEGDDDTWTLPRKTMWFQNAIKIKKKINYIELNDIDGFYYENDYQSIYPGYDTVSDVAFKKEIEKKLSETYMQSKSEIEHLRILYRLMVLHTQMRKWMVMFLLWNLSIMNLS